MKRVRSHVNVALHRGSTHVILLCMQRADLHGRAQDVLKRRLNVTLPELEMPEVLFFPVAVQQHQGRRTTHNRSSAPCLWQQLSGWLPSADRSPAR